MKNTLLTTLLALGIGLAPGFGFNFMSGNSMNFDHGTENPSKTVEMTEPTPQPPTTPKSHMALAQPAPKVPNKVASADSSTVK